MTDYLVYDVFTDTPFGGNPLAVIPDATTLPEADLRRIAREFNFSETTFVYPPKDPAHTARVRIFTTTRELQFAGHPTIGTAIALAEAGRGPDMVLELGVGPIAAIAKDGAAQFTTSVAMEILATPDPALVARALGLSRTALRTDTHAPSLATLGLPFTLVELASREDLSACQPDIPAIREGCETYRKGVDFALFAYVKEGDVVHARMFAPLGGTYEDPATGSACATLGALLTKVHGADQSLTIHQGDDMGRPSRISVATNGSAATISGAAKRVMQGSLVY